MKVFSAAVRALLVAAVLRIDYLPAHAVCSQFDSLRSEMKQKYNVMKATPGPYGPSTAACQAVGNFLFSVNHLIENFTAACADSEDQYNAVVNDLRGIWRDASNHVDLLCGARR